MAKLKSSKNAEVVEEVVEPEVITQEQLLEEMLDEEVANTTILEKATELVYEKFGLDNGYSVTKFECKGMRVKLELENRDFIVNVTVKDRIKYDLLNKNEFVE